jgi:uncharacterized protein (DUF58 family)
VGGLVFDDGDVTEVSPHRSEGAVMRLLKAVVEKNQALRAGAGVAPAPAMLNTVLERAARVAKHDYLVAVISDFDGADEVTRKLMLRMAQHNDVICALVHDPSATKLPEMARLVVSDGELQVELDLGGGRTRERLAEESVKRLQRVIDWQRELGIPVLPIHTAEDPIRQVQLLLGAAATARR